MASNNQQINGEKQPIMSFSFRIIIEQMVAKFADDANETLEFPPNLSVEQRDFIRNYVYKCPGLKSRLVGNGK